MTTAKTPPARHDWVDIAKGISIILVVMMHATLGVGEATDRVGFMHYVLGFAAPFRMPEFFFVSGLFLSAVIARPLRYFADRRVVHYLYFYALWAVILIVFKHLLIDRDPAGTASLLVWALWEPYSILWFIYALAVFGLIARLLWQIKAPHWIVLTISALLSIAPMDTGISTINYAVHYFVFFYAGYALAPSVFRLAGAVAKHPSIALFALVGWALINTALVFFPGHAVMPGFIMIGVAGIPGASFVLAGLGILAICAASALAARHAAFGWLRWIGAHSIVVYLSFVLPMGIFRTLLLAVTPNIDAGIASLAVLIVAILSPIIVYWIIQRIGFGRFLFERPSWAILPGAPGSRWDGQARAVSTAE